MREAYRPRTASRGPVTTGYAALLVTDGDHARDPEALVAPGDLARRAIEPIGADLDLDGFDTDHRHRGSPSRRVGRRSTGALAGDRTAVRFDPTLDRTGVRCQARRADMSSGRLCHLGCHDARGVVAVRRGPRRARRRARSTAVLGSRSNGVGDAAPHEPRPRDRALAEPLADLVGRLGDLVPPRVVAPANSPSCSRSPEVRRGDAEQPDALAVEPRGRASSSAAR